MQPKPNKWTLISKLIGICTTLLAIVTSNGHGQIGAATTTTTTSQQQSGQARSGHGTTPSSSSGTRHNYFGTFVGPLIARNPAAGVISGDVYAVDEQTLFIRSLVFDGRTPDTYFWSGASGATPTSDGFIVPDEKGSTKPLERYSNKDVVLRLPEGKTLREIGWLSLWSRQLKSSLVDISIPKTLAIPRPLEVAPLSRLAHGVRSGAITIVDAQTLLVTDLHYDGLAPAAHFWVTRGTSGLSATGGLRLKDENGSLAPLRKYQGDTVVVSLPDELTVYDFDHFGIWCTEFQVNFGQTKLGGVSGARVPPSPKMLGIKPENKLNCEILYDELGFELRWVLDGDDIVMQLVGKIEPGEYMAFGLGKDDSRSEMRNADAVVAWVERQTGQVHAADYFLGSSKAQCANDPQNGSCPDTKLPGGGDSLTLLHGAIVNGYSMVTFKRPQLGVDELYDQHVYSDGRQSIIWAIGQLNERQEVGYHRLRSRTDTFIDFARNPQWNCPIPDLNASMHSTSTTPGVGQPAANLGAAASQVDSTIVTSTSGQQDRTDRDVAPISATVPVVAASRQAPAAPEVGAEPPAALDEADGSADNSVKQTDDNDDSAGGGAAWFIPAVVCPPDRTFYAQIGPTGGRKGVAGVAGRAGWGVSWYVNGLMAPELVLERNIAYRFVVEGGSDKSSITRRHPLYLTDSPEGGFNYKTDDERRSERIFGGVAVRQSNGQFVPTAEGRLCEWKPSNQTLANPDQYETFAAYQRSLRLDCLPGQAAQLRFTPDSSTPDLIYYQCYINRFMGWRIRIVDSCKDYAMRQNIASNNNNNKLQKANRPTATAAASIPKRRDTAAVQADESSTLSRRQSGGGSGIVDLLRLQHSEPRMSFEVPPGAMQQLGGVGEAQTVLPTIDFGPTVASDLDLGQMLAASSINSAQQQQQHQQQQHQQYNPFAGLPMASDMIILNNSLLNQQPTLNLSTIEQILRLSPADLEFLDDQQLDLVNALVLVSQQQQLNSQAASLMASASNSNSNNNNNNNIVLQQNQQHQLISAKDNKTTIASKMVPKSLHSYVRRLASMYFPVQQHVVSMLTPGSGQQHAQAIAQTGNSSSLDAKATAALLAIALGDTRNQSIGQLMGAKSASGVASTAGSGDQTTSASSPSASSSFSLASLVPKPKIDLSKSNISKKLNKFRMKSGRKLNDPTNQSAGSGNNNNNQLMSGAKMSAKQRPKPANEFNYDIFNNQLAQLERQQKQLQAFESMAAAAANWPPSTASAMPVPFNYMPPPTGSGFGQPSPADEAAFLASIIDDQAGPQHQAAPFGLAEISQGRPPSGSTPAPLHRPVQPTPLGPPSFMPARHPPSDFLSSLGAQQNQSQQHMMANQQQVQPNAAVFIRRLPYYHQPQAIPMSGEPIAANNLNIQPYAPPSDRQRSQIRYLDSTDYNQQSSMRHRPANEQQQQQQHLNGLSTMPSLAMTTHESNHDTTHNEQHRSRHPQQMHPDPTSSNSELIDSLSGSGSGSSYYAAVGSQQEPNGVDGVSPSSSSSSPSNDMDHMLAIERFSKQSSERRTPSIVNPITGEQVHYQDQHKDQYAIQMSNSNYGPQSTQQLSNSNQNAATAGSTQTKPRFSAILTMTNHQDQQQQQQQHPTLNNNHLFSEILDTEQSTQAADLRRLNSSDRLNYQHQGAILSNAVKTLINNNTSLNREQPLRSMAPSFDSDQQNQVITTEPTSSVLIRPMNYDFFASDPPATATVFSTTMPTVFTTNAPQASAQMGPISHQQHQQQQVQSSSTNDPVLKSTLTEPNTSTLVPNLIPTQPPSSSSTTTTKTITLTDAMSSQTQSNDAANMRQHQSMLNYDMSPFVPIELNHDPRAASNFFQSNQVTDHYSDSFRLKPPPNSLIQSMFSQYQSPFRPEPPVQVASYLAQHLAANKAVSQASVSDRSTTTSGNHYDNNNNSQDQIQQAPTSTDQPLPGQTGRLSDQLIILKPSSLLTSRSPQTFALKPEYFKPMPVMDNSNLGNNDLDLQYIATNDLNSAMTASQRLIGHQFDRLSSLSSPPSISIVLDPMQTASSSQTGASASVTNDNNTQNQLETRQSGPTNVDLKSPVNTNSSLSDIEQASGLNTIQQQQQQHRHIPGKLLPVTLDNLMPGPGYNQDQQHNQDKGLRPNPGGDNINTLIRDNSTDNAILSHVMALISSNAVPTPPLVPVASYSNADYFLPISDQTRSHFNSIRS